MPAFPNSAVLDRRITIRRATLVINDLGESVQTWCDLATVWAAKIELPVRMRDAERFAGEEMVAEINTRFRIRYSPSVADVNPKDRVIFDERTFEIIAVTEIGRREGIEITARARAD